MQADGDLRAHFSFDPSQFSTDQKNKEVHVNVQIKGKNTEIQDYKLTVTYNEKLIREKYSIPEGTPIGDAVKAIIEDIKPEEIMQMANSQLRGVGSEMLAIKTISKIEAEQLNNLKENQKAFLHSMIQQLLHGKESESAEAGSVMRSEFEKKSREIKGSPIKGLDASEAEYLKKLQDQAIQLERSFKGLTLDGRFKGAEQFTALRKELTFHVFNDVLRPQIEEILKKHGETRPLNEILCIYGFNRLFTRDRASTGTDVDFMLVLDTQKKEMMGEIRDLIKQTKKELNKIGIDMETADYLIIDLPTYQAKLDSIRSSLFTLANMFNPLKAKDNVTLITGSPHILRDRVFSFTDQQLADHYVTLLVKSGQLKEEDRESVKTLLLGKMNKNENDFRSHIIDNLQKMANSELYIGREPYNKKQTIQTIMSSPKTAEKRLNREAAFSTKFCINRPVDILRSTTLRPEQLQLTEKEFHDLETLGLFLCNTVCFLEAGEKAPVTLLESYSDITLDQMKKMNINDRVLASYFLQSFGISIDPFSEKFPEQLYDGLWQLADEMYKKTQALENNIYSEARALISPVPY